MIEKKTTRNGLKRLSWRRKNHSAKSCPSQQGIIVNDMSEVNVDAERENTLSRKPSWLK